MTRDEINLVGDVMRDIRDTTKHSVVLVALGVRGPTADCRNGNFIATVTMGPDTETGEAVYLADAIALAEGACLRAAEARKAAADKAKATPSDLADEAGI
jgi:hypothetical protein